MSRFERGRVQLDVLSLFFFFFLVAHPQCFHLGYCEEEEGTPEIRLFGSVGLMQGWRGGA